MPIKKKLGLTISIFFGFVALFSLIIPSVSQFKSLQFSNLNQLAGYFLPQNDVDIAVINLSDYDYVVCPEGDTDSLCGYFGNTGLVDMVSTAPKMGSPNNKTKIFIKNGTYGTAEPTFRRPLYWDISGESREDTVISGRVIIQDLADISFNNLTMIYVQNNGMSPSLGGPKQASFKNVRIKGALNIFTGMNINILDSTFSRGNVLMSVPCINLHETEPVNPYSKVSKLKISVVNTTFSCNWGIYIPNAEYVPMEVSVDGVIFNRVTNNSSSIFPYHDVKLDPSFINPPKITLLNYTSAYGVENPGNINIIQGVSTPLGSIDLIDSEVVAAGWTCDADKFDKSIDIHLYADGPAGSGIFLGGYKANGERADVSGSCGGTTNHGYHVTLDQINTNKDKIDDARRHKIYVYAINIKNDGTGDGNLNNPSLTHSGGPSANLNFGPEDSTLPICGDLTFTRLEGNGKIKITARASDSGSGLVRGGLYISSKPNTNSADFGAIPNDYTFGPQKEGIQNYTWDTGNLAPGKYAVASNWWDNSGKPNSSTNDKPGGHLGNFVQCRTEYTVEAVPPVVDRPDYCKSISLSTAETDKELKEGETLTLKSVPKTDKIKKFSFAFYNKDNLTTGQNPTPKGIMYEAGKQFYSSFVPMPNEPVYIGSTQVSYADLYKPDTNWSNKIPQNIQVNAYFTDSDNKVSAADPVCVAFFSLQPAVLDCPKGAITEGDCDIDMSDLLLLLSHIMDEKPYNAKYDLVEDGAIGMSDLLFIINVIFSSSH